MIGGKGKGVPSEASGAALIPEDWTEREREKDGKERTKIKRVEFIFVLIASELRNCLSGKIALAQANYIHLLLVFLAFSTL